jgi:shikimate dehydrogenase
MNINGETRLIAIFGWPLTYTRSPLFQNAGLRQTGLNTVYLPLPVKPADFGGLWRGLSVLPSFMGANVTNPHKQAALRLAGRISPEARAIGAVNTLYRRGVRWIGHNTDAAGFLSALPMNPRGHYALVFGAGGTARALAYALLKAGATRVDIACRRPAQGRALLRHLRAPARRSKVKDLNKSKLEEIFSGVSMAVNTVPDLLFQRKLAKAVRSADALQLAFDAAYASQKNPFLQAARRRGLKACDGLGMLLEQGCLSFRLFTGKMAPKAIMKRVLGH